MNRNHSEHQTRRHRLIGHDYSEPGYYFVTFNTKNHRELLGCIHGDKLQLSPTGRVVEELIIAIPAELGQLEIDCFAIMPNHVHLLLYLRIDMEQISISDIVRLIKGRSAALHRKISSDHTGLWHQGFHDEIVRNDAHLEKVRRYIFENPYRWNNKDRW